MSEFQLKPNYILRNKVTHDLFVFFYKAILLHKIRWEYRYLNVRITFEICITLKNTFPFELIQAMLR